MTGPPTREQGTQELIQRLRSKRARRRRLKLAAACLGGAVVLAAVAAAIVLAVGKMPDDGLTGAGATSSTTAAVVSSGTTSGSSTGSTGATTTAGATTTTARTTTTTSARVTSTTVQTTTTTVRATTTSASAPASSTSTTKTQNSRKVVVIDPGHQARGDPGLEPVGPGSSEKKAKVSDGTAGVVTGTPESKLVLTVGLKLRDALEAHGVKVVMTRTVQDVNLSNIERAQIANDAGADLFVRVHADGSDNPAATGIHVLYPASIEGWTDDIAAASKKAASLAQRELIAATGANDRGIDARSDMTGFNWSDVPAIIPEIGFMTNAAEDKLLATAAYQDKIVSGLTRAILSFLGVS